MEYGVITLLNFRIQKNSIHNLYQGTTKSVQKTMAK